jgi:hypothetical protein
MVYTQCATHGFSPHVFPKVPLQVQKALLGHMGLNLVTKMATEILHHEHEEMCLRALCFQIFP